MNGAKTFQLTASDEAMQYIATAVLTRLLADRSAKRVPGEEYDKFLTEQIVAGHEAVAALNCTSGPAREVLEVTNGMDKAEEMKLAAIAVRLMLRIEEFMVVDMKHVSLFEVMDRQCRVKPTALRTTLLFLESPK